MKTYIVRLTSPSLVRLGSKPYDDEESRRTISLKFPDSEIAITDSVVESTSGVVIRNGLLIQVKVAANDIESGMSIARNIANYAISLLSYLTITSIGNSTPIWAYDAGPVVEDREYRFCFYEGGGPQPTRNLNDQHLLHLLEKNFNLFLAKTDIKEDFKNRVQHALMSFRRGLSDNEDVLNEFLTIWSTMEGLDCVYTKLLPSANVRKFMDGMKDVLRRLGALANFKTLERLRNDIAHGSLSLAQATLTAEHHIETIRKAIIIMIGRIIGIEEAVLTQITSQVAYKGKVRRHVRLLATIKFDPCEVADFDNQPRLKVWLEGEAIIKKENTLEYLPDVRLEPTNIPHITVLALQSWGDSRAIAS